MPRHRSSKSILDLPQLDKTWFVLMHEMRAWVASNTGELVRPWISLVIVTETGMIQSMNTSEHRPDDKAISALLFNALKARTPLTPTKPHRPKSIVIEDEAIAEALADEFADFEIQLFYHPRPKDGDEIIRSLEEQIGGPVIPGLLSVKGVTPEIVGRFFEAAADFYDASPWENLTDSDPINIQLLGDKRKRTVVVMGSGGMEYGLAVYDSWKDYLRMIEFAGDPDKMLSSKDNHALYFNDITETPFDDADGAKVYGWKVHEDAFYPVPVIIKLSEESPRRPPLADILWYEAVLRAIPIFVDEFLDAPGGDAESPPEAKITVETAAGKQEVRIFYAADEIPDHLLEKLDQPMIAGDEMTNLQRAMEEMLSNMGISLGAETKTSDEVQEAQEIMYDAWEESSPAKRIAKAKKALKVSADCADAYVLLAQEAAKTKQEALQYFEQGVAAGERALGKDFLKENAGYFWGLVETRPYMRAREGLANMLWKVGRTEEAIAHFREMLRLNPGDNQGIRYLLLNLLITTNQDVAANKLIREFKDDAMAEWSYSKALLAFRKEGDSAGSKKLLRAAIKDNPHVPALLTGKKRLPAQPPQFIGFGDENEAMNYAGNYLKNWHNTPGAIDWLKANTK